MKSFKIIAGVAALLIGSSSAFAMLEGGRWYADVKGSLTAVQKIKSKDATATANTKQKLGYGASIAAGYALDAWRFELEGAYRRAKVKTVTYAQTGAASDQAGVKGRVNLFSLMGNVCYDIPVADAFAFYVGAGLGYGRMNLKTDGNNSGTRYIHGKANLFAYQLLAGVTYIINDNWSASLGYRFFSSFNKPKFQSDTLNRKIKTKLPFFHSFELGVRYTF